MYLIVHYNRYHNAVFLNSANQITGKINEQYNKVEDYFYLKRTNDSLKKANEILYNKLRADYLLPDSASKLVIDSISTDTLKQYKRYTYMSATVISNAVSTKSNYIVLNKGELLSVKKGMSVVDINNAVVGTVVDVSSDYAVVMSLLNNSSQIDGRLLKTGETGTVSWDGSIPNILSINKIPKSTKVAKGDIIVTSGESTTFPKGLTIGSVTEVLPDKSSNNFNIKLKTAANFYNLRQVYIIDDNQRDAINKVLEKIKPLNK